MALAVALKSCRIHSAICCSSCSVWGVCATTPARLCAVAAHRRPPPCTQLSTCTLSVCMQAGQCWHTRNWHQRSRCMPDAVPLCAYNCTVVAARRQHCCKTGTATLSTVFVLESAPQPSYSLHQQGLSLAGFWCHQHPNSLKKRPIHHTPSSLRNRHTHTRSNPQWSFPPLAFSTPNRILTARQPSSAKMSRA